MRTRSLVAVLLAGSIFLAGCSSVQERHENAKDIFRGLSLSASGSISHVLDMGKQIFAAGNNMADNIENVVDGAQQRVQKVSSGAQMILEGKRLIEEGIKQ